MTQELAPFIKWGQYKSADENKPDILTLRVKDMEAFESEYSTNARVQIRDGTKLTDAVLVLKSHASANASLLNIWTRLASEGKIKSGTDIVLKTWLGKSKNGHPIRRFRVTVG